MGFEPDFHLPASICYLPCMNPMTFEDLDSWQHAREMVSKIYDLTRNAPLCRDFGICTQLQRAGASIMSNIAEGFERGGDNEFAQFLSTAKGSCGEVRSQLRYALFQLCVKSSEVQLIQLAKIRPMRSIHLIH